MTTSKKPKIAQYIALGIFAILFALLVQPYLGAIIFAIFFSIIFHPFFEYFQKKLNLGKNLSAIIVLVITVIFILTPLVIFLSLLISEVFQAISALSVDKDRLIDLLEEYKAFNFAGFEVDIANYFSQIQAALKNVGLIVFEKSQVIFAILSKSVIDFMIFLILYFYMLRDGEQFLKRTQALIPFNEKQKSSLMSDFKATAKTVFIGNIFGAFLSGVTTYIGFLIFQVPAPIIWALVAAILSLLPSLGTLLVYLLGIIIAFVINIYFGIGMIIYFILAEIILVQNVLRPKLLDDKIKVHPILVFFALVGGVQVFGSPGILYGPIIVVIFVGIYEFMIENKTT